MNPKLFNLLAVVSAACLVGGFMYAGQWEVAERLSMMVISGFLALAGVNGAKSKKD